MTEQENRLYQLEQRIIRAWVENDRDTINAILADDWTVIDPSGRVLTKTQVMEEAFESGIRKLETGTIDEVKVRTFGDFAVVTGRTTAAGSYQKISFSVTLRFTDVCVKRGADDAGHQSVEHVVSLFEGPVRRKVAAGMSQERAFAEFTDAEAVRLARKMVAKGAWFDPTLVTYWYRAHQWEVRAANDQREQYVTASARAFQKVFTPLPDNPDIRRVMAASFERFLEITRILHKEGVR